MFKYFGYSSLSCCCSWFCEFYSISHMILTRFKSIWPPQFLVCVRVFPDSHDLWTTISSKILHKSSPRTTDGFCWNFVQKWLYAPVSNRLHMVSTFGDCNTTNTCSFIRIDRTRKTTGEWLIDDMITLLKISALCFVSYSNKSFGV